MVPFSKTPSLLREMVGLIAVGAGLAALGWALVPNPPVTQSAGGVGQQPTQPQRSSSNGIGATADSNRDMIAVTGVDITGVSVLYLIDTKSKHLAVYQASGGAGGTQGVKLVGARDISLDLQMDGFNDKTEYKGRSLTHKDLEKQFSRQGLDNGNPSSDSKKD